MKLTMGGKVYTAGTMDLYDLSLGEAREIQRYTGLTIADWRLGLLTFDRHNSEVLAGLVWLLMFRAGDDIHWDVLNATKARDLLAGFDWSDDTAAMAAALRDLAQLPPEEPPAATEPDPATGRPPVSARCDATHRFATTGRPRRCDREIGHPGEHRSGLGLAQREWAASAPVS